MQQLLEVERTKIKKRVKRAEGKSKGRGKSGEAHDVTSKRGVDEDRNREN